MKNKKLNYNLIFGELLLLFAFGLAIVGLFYTPYDTNEMNILLKSKAPSLAHPFGTDNFGRDILSRVMEGASTSFTIAFMIVTIGAFFGTAIGILTGYYGGVTDDIFMRINDTLAAFPGVLVALVLVAVIGPGKTNLVIALGIIFIPSDVRMIRAAVFSVKNQDYIMAARLMGTSDLAIMFKHILPNIRVTIRTSLLVGFQNAILSEAGLSYLGLGVVQPDPSLGRMLSEAQTYLFNAPWYAAFTGLIIICMTLGLGLVANKPKEEKGPAADFIEMVMKISDKSALAGK